MKRSPMKPRKHCMNRYSPQRIQQFYAEFPERIALAERCGGEPFVYYEDYKPNKGEKICIPRVRCIGGICELCKLPANDEILEPHEERRRSHGAKVSISESIMVHRACHNGKHPSVKLRWIK